MAFVSARDLFTSFPPSPVTPPSPLPSHTPPPLQLVGAVLAFVGWGLNSSDYRVVIIAGALITVTVIACTINYYHEKQASNVLGSIQKMLPAKCSVVRGGQERKIPAQELVLGDLVHLTIGNRIPADLRIISASDFKVENSSLTGESDAIESTPDKKSDLPMEVRRGGSRCRGVGVDSLCFPLPDVSHLPFCSSSSPPLPFLFPSSSPSPCRPATSSSTPAW